MKSEFTRTLADSWRIINTRGRPRDGFTVLGEWSGADANR
jgi:hypothetical protein